MVVVFFIRRSESWRMVMEISFRSVVLLASLSDNLEAIRIWEKNEDSQLTAVPEYLRDVLALFAPDIWRTKEELVDTYQLKYGDKRKPISADTAYQYAHKLEQKDLLTSKRREGGKEVEWTLLDKSNMSKKSILGFRNFDRE
jgi:hypothetical protein